MSVKSVVKVVRKNEIIKPSAAPLPAIREVNKALAIKNDEPTNQVIAVYKDLNQPLRDNALRQQKNMYFAFIIFFILGVGIMMGQHFNHSRAVASAEMNKMLPAGVTPTQAEHYHYDKSCYTGPDGEQVCMTRTSQNH